MVWSGLVSCRVCFLWYLLLSLLWRVRMSALWTNGRQFSISPVTWVTALSIYPYQHPRLRKEQLQNDVWFRCHFNPRRVSGGCMMRSLPSFPQFGLSHLTRQAWRAEWVVVSQAMTKKFPDITTHTVWLNHCRMIKDCYSTWSVLL